MTTSSRKATNSPFWQGEDEEIPYSVNTASWTGYDSGADAVLKDADGEDVSATHMPGAASEAGGVITTPAVIDLEQDALYRLEILWVKGVATFEAWCEIVGEE